MILVNISLPVPRVLRFDTAETFVFNGYEVELYAQNGRVFLGKVGVDAQDVNLSIDVQVPLAAPVTGEWQTKSGEDGEEEWFEPGADGRPFTPSPTVRAG